MLAPCCRFVITRRLWRHRPADERRGRVELVNAQFHDTASHRLANFQSLVRFSVKLKFTTGLAMKLVELHGNDRNAAARATLGGDIAALCASFDALVHAAARFPPVRDGVARAGPSYIDAGMSLHRLMGGRAQ